MNSRTILFALHETEGIGWKTIRNLTERLSSLQEIINMQAFEISSLGIPLTKSKAIVEGLAEEKVAALLVKYNHAGVRWVTALDEEYPELLLRTAQPPWVLYYIGEIELLRSHCISVVGTRTPTIYGKKVAEDLSYQLSQSGLCIVSGMARGIDTSAHRGALRGTRKTIAVLGCSAEQVYPPENGAIYREIARDGLLISEYPLGTAIKPGLFPMRNRIISGLSLGTLVIEAADRSGSLITVDQALDESRDVFAVPGPINSPRSKGTNALIKQGAKMVTSFHDIIEEYTHMISAPNLSDIPSTLELGTLTSDEQKVLHLLRNEPLTIDELLERSQINFGHLHSVLLSLLMKKRVEQLPGSSYIVL